MPITTIDAKTALIIIDLQKGIVAMPAAHPIADVIHKATALADAFRRKSLPVVLVTVQGAPPTRTEQQRDLSGLPADWAELTDQLQGHASDHHVIKKTWGAFTNTGLDVYLKQHGITQVVIGGVATSIGVESTARFAHELGYNVTLATDAMTDRDPDAHTHSVTRIFPRLGETGTSLEIIEQLNNLGE